MNTSIYKEIHEIMVSTGENYLVYVETKDSVNGEDWLDCLIVEKSTQYAPKFYYETKNRVLINMKQIVSIKLEALPGALKENMLYFNY